MGSNQPEAARNSRSVAPASDQSRLEPSPLTPVGITMFGTLQEDGNGGQLRREKKGSEHAWYLPARWWPN
jgi:hypothetical protein